MDFIKKRRIFIINIYFFILLGSISNNLGKDLIKNVPRNLENEHDNYIVLYYNSDCSYQYGFKNSYRSDIAYLINKENNNAKISISEKFNIHKDTEIVIYLNKQVKSLNHFFDAYYDRNMKYLVFVDLSNFDTSKVTTMYAMFYNCSSLKSLDLSNFDTSQVTDMYAMFYGCSSLESLDLSNFDMINCNSYFRMFSNIDRIKYINLYNVKNDKIISNTFNQVDNIIFVCQKDNIIDNIKVYNCCNSNFEVYNCINFSISDNNNSSNKISGGAKISIIIAGIGGFLSIIIPLIIYIYKKNKKKKNSHLVIINIISQN